jgi:hypothetical protein
MIIEMADYRFIIPAILAIQKIKDHSVKMIGFGPLKNPNELSDC